MLYEVITRQGYAVFAEKVREHFPGNKLLVDMEAEGYMGAVLSGRDGRVIRNNFV